MATQFSPAISITFPDDLSIERAVCKYAGKYSYDILKEIANDLIHLRRTNITGRIIIYDFERYMIRTANEKELKRYSIKHYITSEPSPIGKIEKTIQKEEEKYNPLLLLL